MKRARTVTTELAEPPAGEEARPGLLDTILEEHEARGARPRIEGMVIGTVVKVSRRGVATVDFPANTSKKPRRARSVVALTAAHEGREATLMFDGADPEKPVVMGLLESQEERPEASVDGERVVLEAKKEIVLRCGKASITLTRAGKILIRGAYVSSRSSGVNRIKGGSVEIN